MYRRGINCDTYLNNAIISMLKSLSYEKNCSDALHTCVVNIN